MFEQEPSSCCDCPLGTGPTPAGDLGKVGDIPERPIAESAPHCAFMYDPSGRKDKKANSMIAVTRSQSITPVWRGMAGGGSSSQRAAVVGRQRERRRTIKLGSMISSIYLAWVVQTFPALDC